MIRLRPILVAAALVIAAVITMSSHLVLPTRTACDPARDIFIAREYWVPRPDGSGDQMDHIVFSKFDPNASRSEVELGTIQGYRASYRYDRTGRIFLYPDKRPDGSPAGSSDTLYEYSICTGQLQPLLKLPEASRGIDSTRLVGDGETLLVVTSDIVDQDEASNSRLEVYSGGARIRSAAVSEQSPQYARVAIDGATPDGQVVYLSELGSDAGDSWGAYYRWQSRTNVVQKLGDFSSHGEDGTMEYSVTDGYYHGALNPSATLALRVRRGKFEKDDIDPLPNPGCIKQAVLQSGKYDAVGEELVVRDMSTGEDRVIYRNLTRAKNSCLDDRIVIDMLTWLDDRNAAFILPDGIYTIDVTTGGLNLVAALQPRKSGERLLLEGANDDYLFTWVEGSGDSSLVHIRTGKVIAVPSVRQFSYTRFMLPDWSAVGRF